MRSFSYSTHTHRTSVGSVPCGRVRAQAQLRGHYELQANSGRRDVLLAVSGVALTVLGLPAHADVVELSTLYGMDTPPASYGGYGGNSKESPRYKFSYPESWKKVTVNKVQKVRFSICRNHAVSYQAVRYVP
jgi:hypothetical protein